MHKNLGGRNPPPHSLVARELILYSICIQAPCGLLIDVVFLFVHAICRFRPGQESE